MTQKAFAEYFGVPQRTIENWDSERRKCPEYLLKLMEYKLKNEGFIREKDYVLIPQEAIDAESDTAKRKSHIENLMKMQQKISRIAADAEAKAMTEAIAEQLNKHK